MFNNKNTNKVWVDLSGYHEHRVPQLTDPQSSFPVSPVTLSPRLDTWISLLSLWFTASWSHSGSALKSARHSALKLIFSFHFYFIDIIKKVLEFFWSKIFSGSLFRKIVQCMIFSICVVFGSESLWESGKINHVINSLLVLHWVKEEQCEFNRCLIINNVQMLNNLNTSHFKCFCM